MTLEVENDLAKDVDSEEEEVAVNHSGATGIKRSIRVAIWKAGRKWLYHIRAPNGPPKDVMECDIRKENGLIQGGKRTWLHTYNSKNALVTNTYDCLASGCVFDLH